MGPGSEFVGRAAELALLTGLVRAAGGGMARVRAQALPDEGCPPYWLFRPVIGEVAKTFIPNEFQHAGLSFLAPGPQARPPRLDALLPAGEQRFAVFESCGSS
jgi:hypothetical protein